jgi:hypothetical protein
MPNSPKNSRFSNPNKKRVWDRRRKLRAQQMFDVRVRNAGQMTWAGRFAAFDRKLVLELRRAKINNVIAVDLGCGILEGVSPTAQDRAKLLARNGITAQYTAVDSAISPDADGKKVMGISYVKNHVTSFMQGLRYRPNLIVSTNIAEHLLGWDEPEKLARLCWEKLEEKGFWLRDLNLFARYYNPKGVGHEDVDGHFIVLVQKINGKPRLVATNVQKAFPPFGNSQLQVIETIRRDLKITRWGIYREFFSKKPENIQNNTTDYDRDE